MFFKITVLEKFPNLTGKQLCLGVFFNKVADPQNRNFIKKRLQHKFFPVKFTKFLRIICFTEQWLLLQWLLLTVLGFLPASLLKKRLRQRCFSVNFAKFLRTSFLLTKHLRIIFSCVNLWISKSFLEHFFHNTPLGNC